MAAILTMLKVWFVANWKTTVLGAVAAYEIFEKTGDWKAAVTAFLIGLFASDGKTSHVEPKPGLSVVP